jgi:polyhydroxyalkanoate synthesis regulator phasin
MTSPFEKAFLAALGAFELTREKVEQLVDELVKKGEVTKEERAEFVRKLTEKTSKFRTELETKIEDGIARAVDRMKVATKSDLDELQKRIDELSQKLSEKIESSAQEGSPSD